MRKQTIYTLPLHSGERGVALLLTLAIITLVTLLLIAFAVSMRVENSASKNFNDFIKAREIALGAIDQAVATIRQATPQRTENASGTSISNYVTFAGAVYDYDGMTMTPKPLFSQNTTDMTNLNSGFWITGTGEFTVASASQINVGWIYIAEDGSLNPPTTLTKPLVGRFAFWVDDEASKINLDTAGQPTASPDAIGYSGQNEVDLTKLLTDPFAFAGAIASGRSPNPYTTIEEVKRANVGINAAVFDANRFSVTTYSDDANYPAYTDDLDAFGRPRLVVSTLNNPRDINGSGGGGTNNAFAHLEGAVLTKLYGENFKNKYNDNGVKQIVANIIAYQQDPTITPPPDDLVNLVSPTYLGLGKTPYINEVQVKYSISGTAPAVSVSRTVSVELFYMYSGIYTPGAGETVTISGLPVGPGFSPLPITISVSGAFASGAYRVFVETPPEPGVSFSTATPLPVAPIQVTYSRSYAGTPSRLDYSQITLQTLTLDPAVSPATVWHGAQAGDPCVNDTDGQWEKYNTTFVGTMGTRNVWQLGNPPNGTSKGYPFGYDMSKAVIRTNAMVSIGELGYIHRPEPGMHLTLQPKGGVTGAQKIPDWAMLDLFTVGNAKTAGRININSAVNPEGTGPSTQRLVPLKALLNSMNTVISPATEAQHIYQDIPADRDNMDTYGMRNGRDGIFDTIGEICEIKGIADDVTLSEADKEAVIRRIANLITVRSNTFTIWVLAQSIKQPNIATRLQPIGTFDPTVDLITGDVRAQAVVERYENPPGSSPKFRTRYFRYLY